MFNRFYLGVCYYPEHWPARRHESDFRRMKQSGIDLVRMGEGAWSYWEPREGKYQFDLFDRAIDLCRKYKIDVLLGTPTYCGPAWIATNYPQTLRWDFQRRPMAHGSRRNFNYTSPKYLDLSDRICTALAEHYRDNPQVIGWQLDNEFNCHMDVSYAPSDTIAFRDWLRAKYKTIARLNDAWGTAFWSQTYDAWEQIDLPHPTVTYLNPTQLLDESRFISDCVVRFARRQAKILRRHNKRWQITHNGLFPNINGPDLVKELDFFCHDQYPLFSPDGPRRAEPLAQTRSLSFPFGILEQQSGPGGQMSYLQRTPRQGEVRLWAWQSVAHGAKFVSFFRWRTCPYGSEQHWHGLLDYDNRDTRRLAEAAQFGKEASALPADFFDAPVQKAVAILRDFDNEINERRINTYAKFGANEYARWFAALTQLHIPVDYVWPDSSLDGYSVLVAPHQKLLTEKLQRKLTEFVKGGGTLVLAAQSGTKDSKCHMVEKTAPGDLASLAGVSIEDWTTLADDETRTARTAEGNEIAFSTFVERLRPLKALPMAHWSGDDTLLGDAPAITRNKVGEGSVIYIGGYCLDAAVIALAQWVCAQSGLQGVVEAGREVEAMARTGKTKSYLVVLNHSTERQRIAGVDGDRDLLSGTIARAEFTLVAYQVAIFVRNRRRKKRA